MKSLNLYLQQIRAMYHERKDIARLGWIGSAIADAIALLVGIAIFYAGSSWLTAAIGLFFGIWGGYGTARRLYCLVYNAILRGLEVVVVDDEVIKE